MIRVLNAATLAILGQVLLCYAASAAPKDVLPTTNQPKKMSLSKLSSSECAAAHGAVNPVSYSICPSGESCTTTDVRNKMHEVCLSVHK